MPCARAATRCGAFPALFFAPRTALPSTADHQPAAGRTALVHSQAPRPWSSPSALTRAKARRNVDSSAGPRAAPSPASTSGPASAAHCPIAANDLDPGDHRRDPDGEQPGQRVPAAAPLARVRDLGKEIEKVLAAGSRHGRRCHRRAGVPRGRRR